MGRPLRVGVGWRRGHAGVGLADDGSRYLLYPSGRRRSYGFGFLRSRAGFDEPPEVVQEKKHRAAKWRKVIPRRKKTVLVLAPPPQKPGTCVEMSALGHKRTLVSGSEMSALPSEADMLIVGINVCYVPIADIRIRRASLSLIAG